MFSWIKVRVLLFHILNLTLASVISFQLPVLLVCEQPLLPDRPRLERKRRSCQSSLDSSYFSNIFEFLNLNTVPLLWLFKGFCLQNKIWDQFFLLETPQTFFALSILWDAGIKYLHLYSMNLKRMKLNTLWAVQFYTRTDMSRNFTLSSLATWDST